MLGRIAGDQRAVDGADGGADNPVGFDACLKQGFEDAHLVGTQGTSALEDQHHLAG